MITAHHYHMTTALPLQLQLNRLNPLIPCLEAEIEFQHCPRLHHNNNAHSRIIRLYLSQCVLRHKHNPGLQLLRRTILSITMRCARLKRLQFAVVQCHYHRRHQEDNFRMMTMEGSKEMIVKQNKNQATF